MLCAELAAEELVLLPHVLLQLLKLGEDLGLRTAEALGQQQMPDKTQTQDRDWSNWSKHTIRN